MRAMRRLGMARNRNPLPAPTHRRASVPSGTADLWPQRRAFHRNHGLVDSRVHASIANSWTDQERGSEHADWMGETP